MRSTLFACHSKNGKSHPKDSRPPPGGIETLNGGR